MMAGLFLGGKHLRHQKYVDYFILLRDYKYAYPYTKQYVGKYHFGEGVKETCEPFGMIQAAPEKLVSWIW